MRVKNCLETAGRQFLPRDINLSRRALWVTCSKNFQEGFIWRPNPFCLRKFPRKDLGKKIGPKIRVEILGSEQKRPGANRPPEFVPESPLQKSLGPKLWESCSLQGIIGKTHTQNLQILREDTLGATCSAGPFVYFRNSGTNKHKIRSIFR